MKFQQSIFFILALIISLGIFNIEQSQAEGSLLNPHSNPTQETLEETLDWSKKSSPLLAPGFTLAQSGEEAYDPFADFSEFDNAAEEEADINFFLNGRFFTLGILVGLRGYTQSLATIYSPAVTFGLFISYFFDLRFALQVGYLSSSHNLQILEANPTINGNVSFSSFAIDLKYYWNTQNVTRGLAELNPYIVGGFSQNSRTVTVSGEVAFSKDSAFGFDIGGGLEIPLLRNKMYVGIQATYQLVSFEDENSEVIDSESNPTGVFPRGDTYNVLAILGANF